MFRSITAALISAALLVSIVAAAQQAAATVHSPTKWVATSASGAVPAAILTQAQVEASRIYASYGQSSWVVGGVQRTLGSSFTRYYGSETRDKVRAFQRANSLPDTGSVGALTYNKLFPTKRYLNKAGAEVVHSPHAFSVKGRPIYVYTVGDPKATHKILVTGCVHGNECDGLPIVDRLINEAKPSANVAYLVVRNPNPDGEAANTRQNARGVDLNRNFPGGIRTGKPWSTYYPGPSDLSEPESRALYDLTRWNNPRGLVPYHQAMNLVGCGGPSCTPQRAYASTAGMPFSSSLKAYQGSQPTWVNRTYRRTYTMTVELPASVTATRINNNYRALIQFGEAVGKL